MVKRLESICKPQIVDFLRVLDRKRWVFPRIKYASVRSKPLLLKDIRRHFLEKPRPPDRIQLVPKNGGRSIPEILYDFPSKTFLFGGQTIDLPTHAKPVFSIRQGPVMVHFQSHGETVIVPSSCAVPVPPS